MDAELNARIKRLDANPNYGSEQLMADVGNAIGPPIDAVRNFTNKAFDLARKGGPFAYQPNSATAPAAVKPTLPATSQTTDTSAPTYTSSVGPRQRFAKGKKPELSTPAPIDPYANGGDGRVAREERPRNQQVSVAGGVPRDELIRRMDMAARSYAGSPSARAAMMGAYAEQLKAYDTVEINNNNNNNQNDQLTFQQNSSANRQEAQGRQEFGNEVGMLNRKGAIESALATQTAKANAPLAAAQLAELKSRTLINESSAAQKAGAFDLSTKSMANKNITERIIQMGGDPKDPAQYAQVAAMVGREALLNGDDTSDAAKQIAQQDGVALARPFTEAGDRYNGIWARDSNSRTLGEGTSINPGDVEEIADDGSNLYNNAIASWVPGTEADVLTRYKDPKTGEIMKRWLDPSEPEDKAIIDATRMYKNAPGYQKELGPRK